MKSIPNYLSFCRILFSLALFVVQPLSIVFYVIYIACGISDMLDGYIARKKGVASLFGAKLDSIADLIMLIVLFVILYPIVNLTNPIIIWIIAIGMTRIVSMIVVLVKYKTFAILHTYGNKISGLSLFIFPLLLPYIDVSVLINIICIVASLSAIEELMIHLTSSKLQVNKQSIFVK
ncbi:MULTISPECIES: CDP-alcohol phosphatidyltransferase family protein [Paenibacillus]|uniref:Phosphatidylglycerophosphate synthase n=1 Tax=Paenibacillus anaericanus TaxID=170367 RepID=A0A3S1BRY7_9BACL|nr:CDP-alcohol phosphatidyltransferase family protein [Paenibacillus anaericanus]RUT48298.1 phosphatidylglycerophosphate synthase [Paenibacillus anaericanus]